MFMVSGKAAPAQVQALDKWVGCSIDGTLGLGKLDFEIYRYYWVLPKHVVKVGK